MRSSRSRPSPHSEAPHSASEALQPPEVPSLAGDHHLGPGDLIDLYLDRAVGVLPAVDLVLHDLPVVQASGDHPSESADHVVLFLDQAVDVFPAADLGLDGPRTASFLSTAMPSPHLLLPQVSSSSSSVALEDRPSPVRPSHS